MTHVFQVSGLVVFIVFMILFILIERFGKKLPDVRFQSPNQGYVAKLFVSSATVCGQMERNLIKA